MTAARAELSDDEVWAWWCHNCEEYGVKPVIDDPGTIAKVVTLAFAGEGEGGRRGP